MLTAMKGFLRYLAPAAIALTLAACVTPPPQRSVIVERAPSRGTSTAPTPAPRASAPGGTYRVVQGDTLYSIAFRNGVDFRDLATWNNIAAPYTIWPGQTLKLSANGGARPPAHTVAAAPVAHPATSSTAPAHAVTPAPTPSPGFQSVESSPQATATTAQPAPQPATPPATAVASTTSVVPVAGVPASAHSAPPPPAPHAAVPAGASRSSGGVNWRWPADGTIGKRFQSGDAIPGIEILGKTGDPVRAAADGVVVYSGNGLVGYGELIIIKHNDSFLSAYGHNSKRLVKEGQRVSAGQQIAEMGATSAPREELQFQIRKDGNPVDPMSYLPPR